MPQVRHASAVAIIPSHTFCDEHATPPHTHEPETHASPMAHRLPQSPQLSASADTSRHCPLQNFCVIDPHGLPELPVLLDDALLDTLPELDELLDVTPELEALDELLVAAPPLPPAPVPVENGSPRHPPAVIPTDTASTSPKPSVVFTS